MRNQWLVTYFCVKSFICYLSKWVSLQMVQTRLKEQENKHQHLNISSAPLTLNDGDHKNAAHNQGFI